MDTTAFRQGPNLDRPPLHSICNSDGILSASTLMTPTFITCELEDVSAKRTNHMQKREDDRERETCATPISQGPA